MQEVRIKVHCVYLDLGDTWADRQGMGSSAGGVDSWVVLRASSAWVLVEAVAFSVARQVPAPEQLGLRATQTGEQCR